MYHANHKLPNVCRKSETLGNEYRSLSVAYVVSMGLTSQNRFFFAEIEVWDEKLESSIHADTTLVMSSCVKSSHPLLAATCTKVHQMDPVKKELSSRSVNLKIIHPLSAIHV